MSLPFNLELFKKHRFLSGRFDLRLSIDERVCVSLLVDPHGDLLCPADSCEIKFTPGDHLNDDGDQLNSTTTEEIWLHVYQQHSELFDTLKEQHETEVRTTYSTESSKVIPFLFSVQAALAVKKM